MAQRSNRGKLIEGTIRCLERLPAERITTRVIAEESGANIASIAYHFGSRDALVAEAAVVGLDRWLEEIDAALEGLPADSPDARFRSAWTAVETSRRQHVGLARTYVAAVAKAQHEPRLREILAEGFRRSRPNVASVLGLGDDESGADAGGLVLALFHGMLIQTLLDEDLAIEGQRVARAQSRLARIMPWPGRPPG